MRTRVAVPEHEVTAACRLMERIGIDEFAPVPGDNGMFILTVFSADWPDLRDLLDENNIDCEVLPDAQ